MNFKLNMSEITSLVRTFIEEQYGRQTGMVTFTSDATKPSGHDAAILVEVEDLGVLEPEPDAEPAGPGGSGYPSTFPIHARAGGVVDFSVLQDAQDPIGVSLWNRLGLNKDPPAHTGWNLLFLHDPGDGSPLQLLTLADMDARRRHQAELEDA